MISYEILVPSFTTNKNALFNFKNSFSKYGNGFKEPHYLGLGSGDNSSSYYTQMIYVLDYIKNLDVDYIICLDGFDLVLNKPLKLDIFDSLIKGKKIVLSGEANCWPYKEMEPLFLQHKKTRLCYINGGAYIACRKYLINLLEHYLDSSKFHQQRWLVETIQGMFFLVYKEALESKNDSVILDQNGTIFVSMFLLKNGDDYSLDVNNQLTYLETNQIPYFVHFNGDAKDQMPEFGMRYYLR